MKLLLVFGVTVFLRGILVAAPDEWEIAIHSDAPMKEHLVISEYQLDFVKSTHVAGGKSDVSYRVILFSLKHAKSIFAVTKAEHKAVFTIDAKGKNLLRIEGEERIGTGSIELKVGKDKWEELKKEFEEFVESLKDE